MRSLVAALMFSLVTISPAQTGTVATTGSDSQAILLAQQSFATLTGGHSISDVTLNANVTRIVGSGNETGTAMFRAKGMNSSRMDLSLNGEILSEARSITNGRMSGVQNKNGGTPAAQASHNLATDAAWFFPALSCLSQFGNPNYIFKYLGQVQHGGVNTEHIQISHVAVAGAPFLPRLSTTDIYLSATNNLPVAVDFNVHPDADMNKDIPVEILFANWQAINSVQVPFHFQKLLNGTLILDVNVTNASLNTGVADTMFTLP